MDWKNLLKVQQKDFCDRLQLKKLLICEQDHLYSEINIVSGKKVSNIVQSLKLFLNQLPDKVSRQEQLMEKFRGMLGATVFKSRYYNFLSLVDEEEINLGDNHYIFHLKNNKSFKILVKTTHQEYYNSSWHISQEEINNYQLIVCFLSVYNLDNSIKKYPIIFAGFMPQIYLQKNVIEDRLYIDSLLYGGGLSSYLDSILKENTDYIKVAKKYCQKGEYNLAVKSYSQALSEGENNPQLYFLRSLALWKKGDYEGALNDLANAVTLEPDYKLAHHWRGFIHTQLREYNLALKDYNQEIRIAPIDFLGYYKRGFIRIKLKKYLEALDDYSTSLTINPNFSLSYYNRGFIYYKLGDKQDAIDDYNKALILNPNLVQAHFNIGTIQQMMGNYNHSLLSYAEAIRINPHYHKSYYNLAILQSNLGYYQKAIETYENALKINPNFVEAYYNKEALINLQRKEGSILASYEESNQNRPKRAPYLVNLETEQTLFKKEMDSK